MFTAFIVKDLKKHRVVHHKLFDFSNASRRERRTKIVLYRAWLVMRYDGGRYTIRNPSYNTKEAFLSDNPGLD